MDDYETRLRTLELENLALQLDLRYTQKTLLALAKQCGAPELKEHFQEQRMEMLHRVLIQFEDHDPGLAAQVLERFEDNLDE